jgi:hypothetical protein
MLHDNANSNKEFEARSEKLSSEEQSLANQLDEIFAKTDLYKSLQEKNNENIKRFCFFFYFFKIH